MEIEQMIYLGIILVAHNGKNLSLHPQISLAIEPGLVQFA